MAISKTLKVKLRIMMPNNCWYCGIENPSTVDHVQPISCGGLDTLDNLVLACRSCNCSKKDGTVGQLRFKESWNKTKFSKTISANIAKQLIDQGVKFEGFINNHKFWFEGL